MSPVHAQIKFLAVCATMVVFAQQALAAVLILEGTAPSPTAPPAITSAPESAQPQSDPASAALPPVPPLPDSSNSGILKPSTAPAAIASPAAGTGPAAAAIPPDKPMVSGDLGAVKLANSAEVTIEMMPGQTVSVGSRVSFRIASKKAGYLVLIDVDATGHLTQIYPNTASLVRTSKPNGNFIKPGGKLTIPLATDPYGGGVEYVVLPPNGEAMIVAILSPQPVQILDLPDVPPEARSQSDALAFLAKWTSELRIPDDATRQLREVRWSFNAKPYSIR